MSAARVIEMVDVLQSYEDDMELMEYNFVSGMAKLLRTYGDRIKVSPNQFNWLSELMKKYVSE